MTAVIVPHNGCGTIIRARKIPHCAMMCVSIIELPG
jgi:hypothetical protein